MRAISFTSFTSSVKTCGVVANPKGREVNRTPVTYGKTLGTSLSLGGWGCEGKCLISLSTTPIPLESEALMDSGVSILNLSTSGKVLSLLKSITGLHLW